MIATDPLFSLAGKTALITGGTSGIGAMIAQGLVRRGVTTFITGRDQQRTAECAAQFSQEGGTCMPLAADLEAPDGAQRLAEDFAARGKALNILINNAGAAAEGSLAKSSVEDWDIVMNVNVRAAFFLSRALLPQLRQAASAEDPSRIINTGSIGGLHIPNWEAHSYGASKAALHHLTRSLAKALGPDHITVNAIAPGPFPSRLTDTGSDAVQKSVATYIPLGRPGEAADVEGAVTFLASRAGAYVNGCTLPLDGGYIAAL
ncbi:SDR family oxidoreductase [Altericroceibacterium endophyticum]|uniref:SDR family oxidoreductase n=1 Tax=Altericroceibacterium endophyticum TaxID=1808508 RepID=A0A6I4T8S4_9SPHN|nr:SDR family oxidoreductase [Altericroceibacterium endophyticum]MXO67098.1 SDR family oxidoreductase [Altericroceibacterium endophyticum]